MKELSIEQKAQAYDNLIKRLKDFQSKYRFKTIDEYFPELKKSEESKDEKIRKAIIEGLREMKSSFYTISSIKIDDAISWLEQVDQKSTNKIQLNKKYKCIASPRYSAFMIGEIYKPEDKFLCSLMNLCYDCFEPIEDDEQKSDDKIEPKFKVGDYVVGKYISGYISEVRDDCYLLGYQGFSIDKQDSYHLWTIHDVKNGDILVDKDNNIGLYKEEKDDIYWESYIYLGYDNELHGFNIGSYHNNKNTRPATKEQCDALITKMKESGFIWDASIQCIIKEYSYG